MDNLWIWLIQPLVMTNMVCFEAIICRQENYRLKPHLCCGSPMFTQGIPRVNKSSGLTCRDFTTMSTCSNGLLFLETEKNQSLKRPLWAVRIVKYSHVPRQFLHPQLCPYWIHGRLSRLLHPKPPVPLAIPLPRKHPRHGLKMWRSLKFELFRVKKLNPIEDHALEVVNLFAKGCVCQFTHLNCCGKT